MVQIVLTGYIYGVPIGSFLRGNSNYSKIKEIYLIGDEEKDGVLCKFFRRFSMHKYSMRSWEI